MSKEIGKTQTIRLIDVGVIGPVMIWAGLQVKPLPQWAKSFMVVTGAATIIYNWRNYQRQQRLL